MPYNTALHTIAYCTALYYTVLYNTILYCILYCTILYYTVLYHTILYCTILYCTILYYTGLYYTILYCTILYCTILCCTVYYTVPYYTILYYTLPSHLQGWEGGGVAVSGRGSLSYLQGRGGVGFLSGRVAYPACREGRGRRSDPGGEPSALTSVAELAVPPAHTTSHYTTPYISGTICVTHFCWSLRKRFRF